MSTPVSLLFHLVLHSHKSENGERREGRRREGKGRPFLHDCL